MTAPFRILICALALPLLVACGVSRPDFGALGEPEVTRFSQISPPGSDPNSCWGKDVSPAVIETVTHHVLMQPAQVLVDGNVIQPAVYKTETRQDIVKERKETWFLVPCEKDMTPEFISSVQRALGARGMYKGAISGEMNAITRAAVRRYQKPQGLNSGILSLAAARKLGLVAIEEEAAE